jgi:hypothetical protein
MPLKYPKTVRPDAKGRITLGRIAEGVSSYIITQDKNNRIILEPQVEIPAREKWIYEDKATLQKLKKGLKDAAEGKVKSLGSFAKYLEEDDEE